ncbi:HpcH/HpaI aldolase family protein [Biformimicrobium ophioploci]|uniref:Aldolase/citrate lyase family protein n=1 Tax=Biformimicrobium ophioploci TaxID=3036711 RepID=A0ABQ6M0T8_9GAMM|nr:aldolase/citrate lyase family protein [Microbulbifer sp. NKW57]GMG87938.1 aldolase/citrate lyase family protein [Microbulbifer sp. NKW57]
MKKISELKKSVNAGELLVGTFQKTPSSMVSEVLGSTGLDMVCLDAEHSPFDRAQLDQCIFALRAMDMPSLVRVPSAAPEHLLNALDCGATGVVVPHVVSAEMAKTVAAHSHFGAGGRGYAGSTRAAAYTRKAMPAHLADSAAQTVVIAQIEDVEALDQIDEIAAVDGIDCLFVGRIDLTVALGAASPKDPVVVEAVERICAAGKKAGRCVGMFVGDLDEIPHWREQGASLFLLSSDHTFMQQGAASLAARVAK